MWQTSVVAEVHDPKLDFSRSKHIYCYFHPPLNIPEAGLSSHCTPISQPPAIWQHFSVFIPHLFLFDSRLLLSLKCLLWEIVCKGPPFLSTSSSEVIFFPGIYCTAKVPGSRLYLCGCDGCAGAWSCMRTRLPPCISWEAEGSVPDDRLATRCLFTPYCEVESSKFRLAAPSPPPPGNVWRMFRYINVLARETYLAVG